MESIIKEIYKIVDNETYKSMPDYEIYFSVGTDIYNKIRKEMYWRLYLEVFMGFRIDIRDQIN